VRGDSSAQHHKRNVVRNGIGTDRRARLRFSNLGHSYVSELFDLSADDANRLRAAGELAYVDPTLSYPNQLSMGLTMATGLSDSKRLSLEEASIDEGFSKVIDWIERFLCAPNAELGRPGDVCPFARTAMVKRSVEFYVNHSESVLSLSADIEQHMEEFQSGGATQDVYRSRIIVPAKIDDAVTAVESVQKRLKPAFVERHLMIGQFYESCEEPGLWNKTFRPLQAPVPLIAIRSMVPTDIAFLYSDESYVRAYLEKFGRRGSIALRQFETAMEAHK
jgi:hypothetical protein